MSAGTACLDKPGAHNADTLDACRCDGKGRSLAMASRQWRSSLQWDRVDTPPDRTWLCPPCSHVEASTIRQMPFGSHTKTRYRCYSLHKRRYFSAKMREA